MSNIAYTELVYICNKNHKKHYGGVIYFVLSRKGVQGEGLREWGGAGLPYGWGVNACELAFNLNALAFWRNNNTFYSI